VALAVAGADLEQVDERHRRLEGRGIDDLDDDGHAHRVGGRAQPAQRLEAAAGEAVRRRARLPGAAAQDAGAGGAGGAGRLLDAIVDGARPGGEDDLGAADHDVADPDFAGRLVEAGMGGRREQDVLDAGQGAQSIGGLGAEPRPDRDRLDGGATGALDDARARAHPSQLGDHASRGDARSEEDDHVIASTTVQAANSSATHPFRSKKARPTLERSFGDTIACSTSRTAHIAAVPTK
jgi:hypothetical protein